jgi:hypothetical protein
MQHGHAAWTCSGQQRVMRSCKTWNTGIFPGPRSRILANIMQIYLRSIEDFTPAGFLICKNSLLQNKKS